MERHSRRHGWVMSGQKPAPERVMMKKYKTFSGKTVMVEAVDANGTEGFLLYDLRHFWFRIYNEDHSFKDYKIHHHDMKIKIIDTGACFYSTEDGETYLDHSPAALGYKEEE